MPFSDSKYPSHKGGKMDNCPTCGAPKPNENWDWGKTEKSLFAAAPKLLAALWEATAFIKGSNECLSPDNDREWADYCVSLQKSCEEAIAMAEGGKNE